MGDSYHDSPGCQGGDEGRQEGGVLTPLSVKNEADERSINARCTSYRTSHANAYRSSEVASGRELVMFTHERQLSNPELQVVLDEPVTGSSATCGVVLQLSHVSHGSTRSQLSLPELACGFGLAALSACAVYKVARAQKHNMLYCAH
jgi:hypothetical protein